MRGALAGTAATVAMSAVMLAGKRLTGRFRQPPEAIVRRVGDLVGAEPHSRAAGLLASAAHLGFGASVGAALPLLPLRGPAPVRGLALSLAVYALSYQAWVPALGALPRADEDRRDRQGTLLLAHVVYGLALGAALDRLSRRSR